MYFLRLIGTFLLVLIVLQFFTNRKVPNTLGVTDGNFSPLKTTPNGVSTQAINSTKKVKPLILDSSVDKSKDKWKSIIAKLPNARLITEKENYLHFVFTSDFFKFNDDVEFYFDEKEKVIHFKSQSRIGYSDAGVNRKRYEMLKKLFSKTAKE